MKMYRFELQTNLEPIAFHNIDDGTLFKLS